MKWTQCTFLQDTEAGYSQTESSDTTPSLQLSGISTPAKSSENAPQTDGSPTCRCGRETLGCSIHPSTPDEWIASMQASLARTLALLESKRVLVREPEAGFTEKSCVSLAWYDQDSSSWKTYQRSLVTDWEPYSETWPRWGMTRAGSAYAHPMSERRITETDGLLFAAPNTMDSLPPKSPEALHREATVTRPGRSQPSNLRDQVTQMWPTPTAHNSKEGAYPAEYERKTPTLAAEAGGKLNPLWVEWLMGFPIGFTDSKVWAMPKSRSKRQQPGDCLEAAE